MFNEIVEKVLGIGAIVLPLYGIIFTILLIISIVFIVKEFIKEKNIKTTIKYVAVLAMCFVVRYIISIPDGNIISYYIGHLVKIIIELVLIIYLIKRINKKKESNKKIRKIILKIIVLIPVILLILLSIVQIQRNINKFRIDTEFKYKVSYVSTIPITTVAPLSSEQESYYEIDLEKKTVELRKNSIPTLYGITKGKVKLYYRKLEYQKVLTDEECNQLKNIFDRAINGNAMNYNQDQNTSIFNVGYYIIDSKYKRDVVMLNEDEVLFYNIVKK